MTSIEPCLRIHDLSISFYNKKNTHSVVCSISISIYENEILGLVGESGSGKSVISRSIMGLLPPDKTKIKGVIYFKGRNVLELEKKEWKKIRGNKIAMIFQEPMSSLNPTMSCGEQVLEVLLCHKNITRNLGKKKVLSLFEKVKIPNTERLYNQYPYQLSGGQKQRVIIAMALICKPDLLIADEPTTALDGTVQKEIINLIKDLQREYKISVLFISHDLSLVSCVADRVAIISKGILLEQGNTKQVFENPRHNYTKALLSCRPKMDQRYDSLPTLEGIKQGKHYTYQSKEHRKKRLDKVYSRKPLLEVIGISKYFKLKETKSYVRAVEDISFEVYPGETFGLVGESGCGKTTLSRSILNLETIDKGTILFQDKIVKSLKGKYLMQFRKEVQLIFQDPFSSLQPRMQIGKAILEPVLIHRICTSKNEATKYVHQILEKVGLCKSSFYRYPHEFSGGQRQRIVIARAIALKPKLIICDESVSALDVSVQAQVLNLLNNLKQTFGFSYIFISHDLAVVKQMSDKLMIMEKGKCIEIGDADKIYSSPENAYTKNLINSIAKARFI